MKKKQNNLYLLACIFLFSSFQAVSVNAQSAKEGLGLSGEQKVVRAKEHFAAGKEFVRNGNYAAADVEFRKAQQLLGVTPHSDIEKAKPQAKDSLRPKEKEANNVKEIKDPLSDYQKELKLKPKSADLHYNLACEYLRRSEFRIAQEEFKRVIQLKNNDAEACYNLGVLSEIYFNDKKQAIYYYSRYLGLAPFAPDAWRVKGWVKEIKQKVAAEKRYE